MESLYQLSLTSMLQSLDRGDCSVEGIWRSCLEQTEKHESVVHAWQQLVPALGASALDGHALAATPLRGLPIGVKDTIDVRGLRAERGSKIWQGRMPDADAACISSLQKLGGRVMGKTVTTEFAFFTPGATANPHNVAHTPGGSSSGSAAAVAAGMVPFALGSQTAASVIRPAAYCGVTGYVATVGTTSLRGVMPLAHSLDSLGMLARDVADLQYVQALLTRHATAQEPARVKPRAVLTVDGSAFGVVEPEMQAAHESAVEQLVAQGVQVHKDAGSLFGPEGGQAWVEWHRRLMAYEVAQTLAFEYHEHPDALSSALRTLIDEGMAITGAQYDDLRVCREAAIAQFALTMADYDAVLSPAAPGAAPSGLGATGRPDQSRAWQLLGAPQVTLPVAWGEGNLPLGLQIVGIHRSDRSLMQIARWLQDELGWSGRIPPAFN